MGVTTPASSKKASYTSSAFMDAWAHDGGAFLSSISKPSKGALHANYTQGRSAGLLKLITCHYCRRVNVQIRNEVKQNNKNLITTENTENSSIKFNCHENWHDSRGK